MPLWSQVTKFINKKRTKNHSQKDEPKRGKPKTQTVAKPNDGLLKTMLDKACDNPRAEKKTMDRHEPREKRTI